MVNLCIKPISLQQPAQRFKPTQASPLPSRSFHLLSQQPPCVRPFSYRLFLKSALDLIHIQPSAFLPAAASLCIGFLSALERRVLLLAKAFSPSPPQVSCHYRWRMQLRLSPPPQAPLWRTSESRSCIIQPGYLRVFVFSPPFNMLHEEAGDFTVLNISK